MKKLLILSVLILGVTYSVSSQVHLDLKAGISPATSPLNTGIIVNREDPMNEFQFRPVHVNPQFQAGVNLNLQLKTPFFLEGGISYTKKSSDYQVNYRIPGEGKPALALMNESEDILMLPVNIGVSLGSFDVTSGLRAMKTLSKKSELTHLNGFSTEENSFRMGWQMGIRYGLHRTMVGVEFQGSLNRVGQGMNVNGHSLEVMNVPGNFVFSIQHRF